jgi:hypothetical protein
MVLVFSLVKTEENCSFKSSAFSDASVYVFPSFFNGATPEPSHFLLLPDAPNIIVGKEGVLKLLLNLNPHKATGPDQLSTRFLKEMATSITPSLTLIFQTSMAEYYVFQGLTTS